MASRQQAGQEAAAAPSSAAEPAPPPPSESVLRFIYRLRVLPFAFGLLNLAFVLVIVVLCTVRPGTDAAAAAFQLEEKEPITWPISAHAACLLLNVKSYHFQTAKTKRRFLLLNIHASAIAMISYIVIGYATKYRLVTIDAFGHPYVYFRPIQWMTTTPAMLHQICMLADHPTRGIVKLQIVNFLMLAFGLTAHVVPSRIAGGIIISLSWVMFTWEMSMVHGIFVAIADKAASLQYWDFKDPDAERGMFVQDLTDHRGAKSFEEGKRLGVRMIRNVHAYTLFLWTAFGIADILLNSNALTVYQVEQLWDALDVMAKVLFSSSLTMTGVVSLYEAEKQEAWLAEQRTALASAALGAQAAQVMRTQMVPGNARATETTQRPFAMVNNLFQRIEEGWNNVMGSVRERLSVDRSRGSIDRTRASLDKPGRQSLEQQRLAARLSQETQRSADVAVTVSATGEGNGHANGNGGAVTAGESAHQQA